MQILTLVVALFAAAPSNAQSIPDCPGITAISVVDRLSDLPKDIRDDLLATYKGIGDRGSKLLATDAPSSAEMKYPTKRFFRAVLIKNVWYVQVEVAMLEGVRTIGYKRGINGDSTFAPSQYLGGPTCETLRALTNRVYNPGPPYR